jgi:hypothetical protein
MSYQAIYIALRGTTPHVRPRYIRPRPPRPRSAVLGSHGAVFRIPHTPYGIRNSGIGIPESGVQEIFMVLYFPP